MSVVKKNKPAAGKKKKSWFSFFQRKGNQPVWKFALIWALKLALFGLFLMSVLFVLVYIGTFGELPDAETLIKIKEPVGTEVMSQDGKVLGRYYVEKPRIPIRQVIIRPGDTLVPTFIINCFVS